MLTRAPAAKADPMTSHMNLNAHLRVALAAAMVSAVLLGPALLGGCDRAPARPAPTADMPETPPAERAADGAVAVPACAQDCGEGISASIQCAAGEVADCSCDDGPRARCVRLEAGR